MKDYKITNFDTVDFDNAIVAVFTLEIDSKAVQFEEYVELNFDEDKVIFTDTDTRTASGYNDKALDMLDIERDSDEAKQLFDNLEMYMQKHINIDEVKCN